MFHFYPMNHLAPKKQLTYRNLIGVAAMGLRTYRRVVHLLFLLALTFVAGESYAAKLETVKVAPDNKGFVLHPSGDRYIPWGHNYASVDIMERLANDPARVEREFSEMKAAGTTVARIHPEMPRILLGPDKADPHALKQLKQLLEIAERSGIYLKITGLACYKIEDRMAWYDSMTEKERWKTQAFFWETIARTCAESSAVFAYDLVNEPGAIGKPEDGWYLGRMGDVEFCQRLSLNPGTRKGGDIFSEWTTRMVAAIRKHDQQHLITMGMLPFPGAYKTAAEQLDFVSPHLYPKTGKVEDTIKLLQKFDWGKPIVIGETFPLSCGVDDERAFLLQSREFAHGWIGHWPDESPAKLAELKRTGEATIQNAIWLSWVELFQEIGPQMTGEASKSRQEISTPKDWAQLVPVDPKPAKTGKVDWKETSHFLSEPDIMRRDPSDVIRCDDTYYVWYTKILKGQPGYPHGWSGSVWYATSQDGHQWEEQGEALQAGSQDDWDSAGVYTPNILPYQGKYYLAYTAMRAPFDRTLSRASIGIAVSDSPDGPWKKLESNPIIEPSNSMNDPDSFLCDDAVFVVHDDKIWLYYKGFAGQDLDDGTRIRVRKSTFLLTATADKPEGPYTKVPKVLHRGHEALVWKDSDYIGSMCMGWGPVRMFASTDGIHFNSIYGLKPLLAAGIYRADLAEGYAGSRPTWGIAMPKNKDQGLCRIELIWPQDDAE